MSVKLHNATYEQKLNKKTFRAPRELVSSLKKNGFKISSGANGKVVQVYRNVAGKNIYMATLASFLRGGAKYTFRDGDSRNITLRNVKAK